MTLAAANPSSLLESVLAGFKIPGKVVDYKRGPLIDVFDVRLPTGVRFRRVELIADDIARHLCAHSVRVSQLPTLGVVRIEAARQTRDDVTIAKLFQNFAAWHTYKLPVGLGLTVTGEPLITDLANCPHLLIAGTTGSGKSVLMNAILLSLIAHKHPADMRLILADPKRLEFSRYGGIPHMLEGIPVLTEPDDMIEMLQRAIWEMEDRYKAMSDAGHRDLGEWIDRAGALYRPRIVIMIDELADLMAVAGDIVEDRLRRLAAMGRAAGIHLVIATQRPSVDVITGVIKANFPSRICMRVASKVDSRVVLDSTGGETLLGYGDMLFLANGAPHPVRVHGADVPTATIEAALERLK